MFLTNATRKHVGNPRHRKKKRLSDSEVKPAQPEEVIAASSNTVESTSTQPSTPPTPAQHLDGPHKDHITANPEPIKSSAPAPPPPPVKTGRPSRLAGMLYGAGEKKSDIVAERLPASQENTLKIWQEFLQNLQQTDNLMYNFASTASIQLQDNETLLFNLSSNLTDGALSKMKTNILQFFKKKMEVNNPSMETNVELIIEVEEEKSDVGSPSERLTTARQSNPALGALIDQLGLDFN